MNNFKMDRRKVLYRASRLDHQPLFGKGARAPPLKARRDADQTRESGGNRVYRASHGPQWENKPPKVKKSITTPNKQSGIK